MKLSCRVIRYITTKKISRLDLFDLVIMKTALFNILKLVGRRLFVRLSYLSIYLSITLTGGRVSTINLRVLTIGLISSIFRRSQVNGCYRLTWLIYCWETRELYHQSSSRSCLKVSFKLSSTSKLARHYIVAVGQSRASQLYCCTFVYFSFFASLGFSSTYQVRPHIT